MKKLLILLLLQTAFFVTHAQSIPGSYNKSDSLIKMIPDGRHFLYTVGGKLQTPEDIKIRIMSYKPSALEYQAAKNDVTCAYIFTAGAAISSFGAGLEFANNNKAAGVTIDNNGNFVYQQHSHTAAYIFTGAAIGFLTAEIIYFVKAAKHGRKMVKVYNQQFQ